MEIAEFLAARLDEDQALAQAADITAEPWRIDPDDDGRRINTFDPASMFTIYDEGGHTATQAEHIVRWQPKNALPEITAKRKLIHALMWNVKISEQDDRAWFAAEAALDYCLRHFAVLYADHPDFDPAWAADAAH